MITTTPHLAINTDNSKLVYAHEKTRELSAPGFFYGSETG